MSNLDLLRIAIAGKLCAIENIIGEDYVLTLIARHKSNPDAHIIVTADHLAKAIEAVAQTPEIPNPTENL